MSSSDFALKIGYQDSDNSNDHQGDMSYLEVILSCFPLFYQVVALLPKIITAIFQAL